MSKLIECPTCKNKVSIDASSCPKCGQPLNDDIKNSILDKQKNDKKNAKIGCLFFIIICLIIGYFTNNNINNTTDTSKKYFSFNEDEFVKYFTSASNDQKFVKVFGNTSIIKQSNSSKETGIYQLNKFSNLVIHNNQDGSKVRSACITYENSDVYRDDDDTVLALVQYLLISFLNLDYLNIDDLKAPIEYFRDNIISKDIEKRKNSSTKTWEFNSINKKDPYPIEIVLKPKGDTGDMCVSLF